ncbi:HlyD family type I secretion periplasmic adaptor subunit [Pseudomonas sp. LRF_L74]|uniref:HlyD family type I secretion periplasmic adaptor subunit n=1 Tax=Pseudomonas sp. LRF_L74 TaxID=3369422 RepID=UPI003F5E8C29
MAEVLPIDERRYSRMGWWLLLLGFGGFIAWAALAPLDKGVAVSGNVVVAGNRQAVQHPGGGVLERLLVRDGDAVQAGQLLVQVDATQAAAQRESLFVQRIDALARSARLEAERDDLATLTPPRELAGDDDPRIATSLALQQQLLDNRRAALRMELASMDESIAGNRALLDGLRAAKASKEAQRASMQEQLSGMRELAREGYVARNRLLESERLYAQLNGDISSDIGNIGRTERQVLELRLRLGQRHEEYQRDVRQQLAEARLQADDLGSRLRSAEFELAHTQLRAPVDGVVVGLDVFTEGGVIAPGQTLMEIVPRDAPLLVDAKVPVELVDKLHPGLDVELLFSAFNQSKTPRVDGKVTLVSADRLLDEKTDQPYYKLRVQVDEEGLRQLQGQVIRPGMPVEAFVRTGERSLLNYLFKPLADRTHMALVEE